MIHQGNIASVHMVRRLVSVIVTRSVFILWRSGFGSLLEQGTRKYFIQQRLYRGTPVPTLYKPETLETPK